VISESRSEVKAKGRGRPKKAKTKVQSRKQKDKKRALNPQENFEEPSTKEKPLQGTPVQALPQSLRAPSPIQDLYNSPAQPGPSTVAQPVSFGLRTPPEDEPVKAPRSSFRVYIPSSLPPSSPPSSSPFAQREVPDSRPPTFASLYRVSSRDTFAEGAIDNDAPLTWSEDDKENRLPVEEEDKENRIAGRGPDFFSDEENIFAPAPEDIREASIGWDIEGSSEKRAITAVPEDINPFDVSDNLQENMDSDKENINAHDFVVYSSDVDLGPHARPSAHNQLIRVPSEDSDDPFGILAAEKRRKLLRAQEDLQLPIAQDFPEAGPSTFMPAGRRPFGPRTFDQPSLPLVPSTPISRSCPLPHSRREPPTAKYSDSEIEALYATPIPQTVPRTPRKRKSSEMEESFEVVMTPLKGSSAREITVRKRRRKDRDISMEEESPMKESSVISSPSPIKISKKRGENEDEEREVDEELRTKQPKGKGKENSGGVDADDLHPTRRSRQRRAAEPQISVIESDDANDQRSRRKDIGRGRSLTRTRSASRGRARGKSGGSRVRKKKEESTDEEVREVSILTLLQRYLINSFVDISFSSESMIGRPASNTSRNLMATRCKRRRCILYDGRANTLMSTSVSYERADLIGFFYLGPRKGVEVKPASGFDNSAVPFSCTVVANSDPGRFRSLLFHCIECTAYSLSDCNWSKNREEACALGKQR